MTNKMEMDRLQSDLKFDKPLEEPAVLVRNAYKYYGSKKDSVTILDGFNMTVSKGIIYGLLGASGCGKTTLLNCILGQNRLNSGEIQVLGKTQGTNSSFYGTQIGYMPQETGLYGDFTIKETLLYFGWITGMKRDEIKERTETLMKTFLMPETQQRVKTLSGGEQRRVSLISALLHEPQLLILDEPTVGVDPLLRENVWNYLKYLTEKKGVTVIITTHYIEETRRADITALMRGGKLLTEESPDTLLARYESQSLEEIFLKLSIKQNYQSPGDIQNEGTSNTVEALNHHSSKISSNSTSEAGCCSRILTNQRFNFNITDCALGVKLVHMKALVWKNALWWWRNIPVFTYIITLAVALNVVCWISVGPDPHHLSLAVINYEKDTVNCDYALTCNSTQLSCNFLERLRNRSFILVNYTSEEAAKESTVHGDLYGYIVVPHNYSAALRARIDDYSTSADVTSSVINVIRDNSNIIISYYLTRVFYEEFRYFINDYLVMCDGVEENFRGLDLPLNWEDPVFGSKNSNYSSFIMPGNLIVFTFVQGIFLTAATMLIERKEANLGRTFVLGVTEIELLLAHLITELVVMIIHAVLMVIIGYVIIDTSHQGSISLIILLVILTGVCGMCYGLLISILCNTEIMVTLAALGTFLPAYYFCGFLWPLEGMHKLIRPFTPLHPITKPILGVRAILYKGWDSSDEDIYLGFVSLIAWSAIFLIGSFIFLKINK